MLPSELEKRTITLKSARKPGGYNYAPPESIKVPKSMDWRAYGAVTEVRNQKKCGACWAFATVNIFCIFDTCLDIRLMVIIRRTGCKIGSHLIPIFLRYYNTSIRKTTMCV